MIISVVMRKPVHCIMEEELVVSAAKQMREFSVGFLPVLDADGRLIGAITARDVACRFVAGELPPNTPIRAVMSRSVPTCRARNHLFSAQVIMREQHVRHVVCVDDVGVPVGILTLADVALHEDGFRLAKTVREATQAKVAGR